MENKTTDFRKRMLEIESRCVDKDGKLSSNKIVNLKEVLGHGSVDLDEEIDETISNTNFLSVSEKMPEVPSLIFTENDFDIEECESDLESNEPQTEVNVTRKSSLKIKRKLENKVDEDEQNKHVVFADTCGVTLADVREMQNADEPPKIPRTVLRYLPNAKIKKHRLSCEAGSSNNANRCKMTLLFEQPGINFRFKDMISDNNVKLESCVDCEDKWTISGIIAISLFTNINKVFVRMTFDRWKSWQDYECAAMEESEDMAINVLGYRRFVFSIVLSQDNFTTSQTNPTTDEMVKFESDDTEPSQESKHILLEFAIACLSDVDTYWDNNFGKNYSVCVESFS
ncbi:hypothetical protein HELRODRAFT_173964 [Helobdella robusta]|uniref:CBM21 domain-containing protein n=1 Tax=Helobdella robusta TaxID=6412 RepID=T1F7F3_HELRO|nr:hypothetical protein HELRODRAFT_173964 [Helobdella robusta]ESO03084.1 hypothetical protein HELRODRAFT_173964 [Helobdella robusta]